MKDTLVARRPAETTTVVAGAVVGLAARVFHLDGTTVGYLTIIVGTVPAGVTWLVNTIRGR